MSRGVPHIVHYYTHRCLNENPDTLGIHILEMWKFKPQYDASLSNTQEPVLCYRNYGEIHVQYTCLRRYMLNIHAPVLLYTNYEEEEIHVLCCRNYEENTCLSYTSCIVLHKL